VTYFHIVPGAANRKSGTSGRRAAWQEEGAAGLPLAAELPRPGAGRRTRLGPKWLIRQEFSSALGAKKFDTLEFLLYTLCFVRAFTSLVVSVPAGHGQLVSRGSEQLEGSSLPEQSKTEWKRGAAGYGTPVPQSRVSLSDSEAKSVVLPLGVRAEFLLVSGFAVNLSA